MNREILCTWLGLPKTAWPPDPWTLLGLTRGTHDPSVVEERVQDRMTKLRCYQLSYPEEATEGMNRLAEAFVTLMEAGSKKPTAEKTPATTKPAPIAKDDTSVISQTQLDWRNEPPPVRQETASAPELLIEDDAAKEGVLLAQPFVAPARPHCREIDPALVRELAELSDEATCNVGTFDAVILRVDSTRLLLHTWDQVGKQLKSPTKKISPKECEVFAARLEKLAAVMHDYPGFLGHPGIPGYRVMVLARLKIPLLIVRAMPEEQRADLLFDWHAARQVLLAHRKYLRRHLRAMRQRTGVGLFFQAVRAFLNDHPRLTLIGILIGAALAATGAAALLLR